MGAIGWLDAGGPGTLAYDGGPEDAQGEWNQALFEAAADEVLIAGFDPESTEIENVIWDAAWDARHEHRGGSSRAPLGPDSPFSAISVRWRETFPEASALLVRLKRNGTAFDGSQIAEQLKEDALLEFRSELWAEIFKHGFRWSSDEWWPLSVDIAASMYEALTVDQMCRLVSCLRWGDVAGATGLLDLVTSHDEKRGGAHFNRLTIRRELDGQLRIHIAQLPTPVRVVRIRDRSKVQVVVRLRTGARQRSSRGRAIRVRGSKRVTSRSAGGGGPGDHDEPERAYGPLPAASVLLIFVVAFFGTLKVAMAIEWEGAAAFLLFPFVLIGTAATVEGFLGFAERLLNASGPIRSGSVSATDPKDVLRASVRVAQERYEAEAEAARQTRRDAFAEAQKEGLSLNDIAAEVGLHRSRIGQIIEGK